MRRPVRTRSVRPPKPERQAAAGSRRDRLAVLLALMTVVCLGSAFFLARDTQVMQFLMPGPLASAHGAIENCSACHTKSGSGKLSWIHGVVARDPLADSKACLTCHKMPEMALNAHGVSDEVLEKSTKRLAKIAAETPAPQSARAQSAAFPTQDMVARGLYCATCHQEHQGGNFKLNKLSNEQCQSCHVAKFDSFDGHHPKFESYPFKRRTRIIYDHAGHFGKHFPEVAKTDPARRRPATCATCHDSGKDRRVMAVAPFEQTCAACHLGQITGKERISGPKGIAFLTLPGLDLQTLKKKNVPVGEWPAASEAELTPFMKVMISRNERGRALIETVERLNLQDLTDAGDNQIKAVAALVWEIKRLFHALISGKASDVLADLNVGGRAKLSTKLVADLTASIPRDVVASAQQQWLPNLGTEMASRQDATDREQIGWTTKTTGSRLAVDKAAASMAKPSGLAQPSPQTPNKSAPGAAAAKAAAVETEGATRQTDAAGAKPGKERLSADQQPQAKAADQTDDLLNPTEDELRGIAAPIKDAVKAAKQERLPESSAPQGGVATGKADSAKVTLGKATLPADGPAKAKAADQTDDLLNPTEEELRGIAAPIKAAKKNAQPEAATGKTASADTRPVSAVPADVAPKAAKAPASARADPGTAVAKPQAKAAPAISIETDVDAESWAEYGGWYRQDFAIFYRPTGHKDKFIHSWLLLTGPQAPKGATGPAAAVFDLLTSKDAQGSCTKCHSVDDIQGEGRLVNFSPPSVGSKQGRFTHFIHEPHFGLLENRGCLTCHNLEKGRPYLKSYEQGNPKKFVSNFGAVKQDLCQTCHTSSMARQDCLLCHKYHVNGVIPSTMNTKVPTE